MCINHRYCLVNFLEVNVPMEQAPSIKKQNIPCAQNCPACPLWSPLHQCSDLYYNTFVLPIFQLYINGNLWCVVSKSGFFCSKLTCSHCTEISLLSYISWLCMCEFILVLTLLVHQLIYFTLAPTSYIAVYTDTPFILWLYKMHCRTHHTFKTPLYCWWKYGLSAAFSYYKSCCSEHSCNVYWGIYLCHSAKFISR